MAALYAHVSIIEEGCMPGRDTPYQNETRFKARVKLGMHRAGGFEAAAHAAISEVLKQLGDESILELGRKDRPK